MQSGKREVSQLLRQYPSLPNGILSMLLHNLQDKKMLFRLESTIRRLVTIINMVSEQTVSRVASTVQAIPQLPMASPSLTALR
jgi:hypothetical protein